MKREFYSLIWSLCWATMFLIACSESEKDFSGDILGTVIDKDTSQPLQDVLVSIPGERSQRTESDGSFRFQDIPANDYTLTFEKDGYETGTRQIALAVGESKRVDMLLAPLRPQLSVSLKTLDFGKENTTLSFDISNTGKGVLEWKITEDIEWLECKPLSGHTEKESSSVVVNIQREGWVKGEYSRTFAISSNGGSEVITVMMTVEGNQLQVSPAEIDLGTTETTAKLTLSNKGGSAIDFTAKSSNEWLVIDKGSGTVIDKDYINVSVNRGALAAGDYQGTVTIQTSDESIQVPVKLTISAKSRPVVSFDAVKNVAYNGATLSGTIVSLGNSNVKRYGFCWSLVPEPTLENSFSNMGDCTAPIAYQGVITDLAPSTKYYVRAYAENNEGISYSNEESFTTSGVPVVPTVQTQETTEITHCAAKGNGVISSLGNVIEVSQYGHVWSVTSEQPDISLSSKTELGKTDKPMNFSSELKDLLPNQKYYIRAYATNEKGTSYGETMTFTTLMADMKLNTLEVKEIVHNAATCGGELKDTGGRTVKECGICWSKNEEQVSITDAKVTGTLDGTNWWCRMEGLQKETTYFVRAYAISDDNFVFYGNIVKFTTTQEMALATVESVTVSAITTSGATLQSKIIDTGNSNITKCGFCIDTQKNPTIESLNIVCELANNAFGQNINVLKEGTKYYVRAYATNAMGTAYSENAEFTTVAISLPSWGTATVSNIGKTKVDVKADLLSNGNDEITEMGICWSTHPETTIYDNKQICKVASSISDQVTGLQGTSTYYLRAYAQNSKGVGYSNEVNFTTSDSETDVWDGTSVATSFAGGSGTSADPIQIATAAQLKLLADKVNAGTSYAGIYFVLTSNISLGNKEWTPIGKDTSSSAFAGNIDGKGLSVSGMKITAANYYGIGLIGCMSGGSIFNLKVSGNIKTNYGYVAMLCGYARENVAFDCIETSGNIEAGDCVGGIIGSNARYRNVRISNAVNHCKIIGKRCVGGLVGGGSANYVGDYELFNCLNDGHISGSDDVGGVVGGDYPQVDFLNCCNYADITNGYGINQHTGGGVSKYHTTAVNCFWLNDIVNNKGVEAGFGTTVFEEQTNCGYFTRSATSCSLIQLDNKDLVEELNKWVEENGTDKYRKWKYETKDGFAIPVMK